MKKTKLNIFTALLLMAIPTVSFASVVDVAAVTSAISDLMDKTLKSPVAAGSSIVYTLAPEEACDLFMGTGSYAGNEAACDEVATKFHATQVVTVDSASAGEGRVTWSYDGNQILKYWYAPSGIRAQVDFAGYVAAMSAMLTAMGEDPSAATAAIPAVGKIEVSVDKSVMGQITMRVDFPEDVAKSWGDAGVDIKAGSFISFLSKSGSNQVAVALNFENSFVNLPASLDAYTYGGSGTMLTQIKHAVDKLSGTITYQINSSAVVLEDFLLDGYKVTRDGANGFELNLAALDADVDLAGMNYVASSALDLTFHVDEPLLGGNVAAGDYEVKHDAGGNLSYSPSAYLVDFENLSLKGPDLSFLGLPAGASHLTADQFGGSVLLDLSNGTDASFSNVVIKDLELKAAGSTLYAANQVGAGELSGSFTMNNEIHLALTSAQDLRVVSSTSAISYLPVGSYQFTNSALTFAAEASLVNSYNIPSLVAKIPYGGKLADITITGASGTYAHGDPVVVTGTLGNVIALYDGETIANISQSAPSNISVGMSGSMSISASAATNISVSAASALSGTGDLSLAIGANTLVNTPLPMDVATGSVAIVTHGFADWIGTGAPLEGILGCDGVSLGACSVALNP